ncbi:MAG: hypothetical protein R6X27_01510, partial [Candidatus Desulfacyla sp.]
MDRGRTMNSGDPGKPENQEERAGGSVLSRVANGWSALSIFSLFELRSKGMRERILLSVIIIGILFSGLAAVPAVLLTLRERLWVPLSMDVAVLACGLGLLIGKGLRYEVKAWAACALIYIVGVYVVFFFGFLSGGPIWLFSFAVVCGLLLGVKPAIIAICVNVATLGILGWLHAATPLGDNVPFFFSPLNALAAGGNFIFLNTLVAISCALLIQDEKEVSISLTKERSQILEAKRRLEEEVLSRKEAEKSQRELARELEFLHATAVEFVNVRDEESLYRIIGTRIKAILGDVVVLVNSYEPETRQFCTMAVEGMGAGLERILNVLGRDPVGMITTLNDESAEQTLKTGKLADGPKGIHGLSFGAIPKAIAHSLEKLVGIRWIYVVGLVREGELFGSAIIVDRSTSSGADFVSRKRLVEAYVNQASLALLRNRFERELKES